MWEIILDYIERGLLALGGTIWSAAGIAASVIGGTFVHFLIGAGFLAFGIWLVVASVKGEINK